MQRVFSSEAEIQSLKVQNEKLKRDYDKISEEFKRNLTSNESKKYDEEGVKSDDRNGT